MKTQQEIFDAVLDHLATQKKRSASRSWECQYRTVDGLKCAVGALIPDNLYDDGMDNSEKYSGNVENIAQGIKDGVYSSELNWVVTHEDLLHELQRVHDNIVNWGNTNDMRRSILFVSNIYKLNTDRVEPTIQAIFEDE